YPSDGIIEANRAEKRPFSTVWESRAIPGAGCAESRGVGYARPDRVLHVQSAAARSCAGAWARQGRWQERADARWQGEKRSAGLHCRVRSLWMARLVEWHDDHARDAERVRFRSAVRRRRLREWLRRIPCRCQRPVLLHPAKEKILTSWENLTGLQISKHALRGEPCFE